LHLHYAFVHAGTTCARLHTQAVSWHTSTHLCHPESVGYCMLCMVDEQTGYAQAQLSSESLQIQTRFASRSAAMSAALETQSLMQAHVLCMMQQHSRHQECTKVTTSCL
jgi:hypothetical protein